MDDNSDFKRMVLRHKAAQRKRRRVEIEDRARLSNSQTGKQSSLEPRSRSSVLDISGQASQTQSQNDVSYISESQKGTIDRELTTSQEQSMIPQESRLSKTLSENNQRNVILLVLVILFSIPFFSVTNYIREPKVH
jgi:hypothetical protein